MIQITARKVKITPPTIVVPTIKDTIKRKRLTAGYARVSTDSRDQKNSYDAQVAYFTDLIQKNDKYEFVGMYSDEGLSGTNADKRDGFNRMVQDALDGKIELILIKSISRLGRNTVLMLSAIRQLKEKGVEIYFEEENISTLETTSEVLLTIFCSLAQEESRKISDNVKWGIQRRMESGKVSLAYSRFLGYDKGEEGILKVNPNQAKIVQMIFRLFLQGQTYRMIAGTLTANNIPTPSGKVDWSVSTVRSILQNEKYRGDAVMGKTFTPDFLTKKVKVNQGESFKYEFEGLHEPIISPEVFALVQTEIARRKAAGRGQSGVGPFASRVVCGVCGGFYGGKVWHSTSKYRKKIYRCNRKYAQGTPCDTPHLTEEALKTAFVKAFNQIMVDKDAILRDMRDMVRLLTDTAQLERQCQGLMDERDGLHGQMNSLIQQNARAAMDQEEFNRQYYGMENRYLELERAIQAVTDQVMRQAQRRGAMELFIQELSERDALLEEFDESLWFSTAIQMTVQFNGAVIVQFRSGMEITVIP